MKALLIVLALVFSTFSFAGNGELFSADLCMRSRIFCVDLPGVDFLTDQDGRCGCVNENEYFSAEECKYIRIYCAEGSSYSSLQKGDKVVGCGCFKTAQ